MFCTNVMGTEYILCNENCEHRYDMLYSSKDSIMINDSIVQPFLVECFLTGETDSDIKKEYTLLVNNLLIVYEFYNKYFYEEENKYVVYYRFRKYLDIFTLDFNKKITKINLLYTTLQEKCDALYSNAKIVYDIYNDIINNLDKIKDSYINIKRKKLKEHIYNASFEFYEVDLEYYEKQ